MGVWETPPPLPQQRRRRKHNKKNKIYKRGSNYSVATKGCLLRAIIMWLNLTPRVAGRGGEPRPRALSIHTDAGSCYLPSVLSRAAQLNGSQESHKAGQNFLIVYLPRCCFYCRGFSRFISGFFFFPSLSLFPLTPEQTGLYFLF